MKIIVFSSFMSLYIYAFFPQAIIHGKLSQQKLQLRGIFDTKNWLRRIILHY